MSTRNKQAVSFRLPVYSFRALPTPLADPPTNVRRYFCVVRAEAIPEEWREWLEVNARVPDLKGRVPKAIRQTLVENPEWFVAYNRGLTLNVHHVEYDNRKDEVRIDFSDPNLHGVMDGGHTLEVILQHRGSSTQDDEGATAYCTLEVFTGVSRDVIAELVEARNTSRQVASKSLRNLEGAFEGLKSALRPAGFDGLISWKENQDAEVDVRDVIALLTCMDRTHYSDEKHPVVAYAGKEACLNHFEVSRACYERVYPVAADVLRLAEVVQARVPGQYNNAGARRFGGLKGCDLLKKPRRLPFTGLQTEYEFPTGYLLPVVAAFRAFLEQDGDRDTYRWVSGVDPCELVEKDGLATKLFVTAVLPSISRVHNPNATGKDVNVWALCYQTALVHYLRLSRK